MLKQLASLARQRGLTTVEYAVAGGVIVAGVVASFLLLGDTVKPIIDGIIEDLGG